MGWLIGSGIFLFFLGLSIREMEEISLFLTCIGFIVLFAGVIRQIKEKTKKK